MFTTWPKRTKVMLGIASGLLVIAIALGVWGYSTGKIKTFADQYWFPGSGGGKISGTVTCTNPCSLSGGEVTLFRVSTSSLALIGGEWSAGISSDGSYSFNRVPFNGTDESYSLRAMKGCPPTSGELGRCLDFSGKFKLTSANPNAIKNLTLKPYAGPLTISVRQIIVGGPKPTNCSVTGTAGTWDCPVPSATVNWSQGNEGGQPTADQNGAVKLKGLYDYRQGGSVNITASKGSKSGSGSTNVIGCQQNSKNVYIQ